MRAEAASEGINWWGVEPMTRALDATFSPPSAEQDAEHIASWHPAVALAVADMLDDAAAYYEGWPNFVPDRVLDVAQAYLGEPS